MSLRKATLLAGLLTAMIPAATAATPPGIPDGWTDGYVYANGIRIHYYRAIPAPGKPVIVMAHGATDIGLSWTTLTKELQADYDIYMVDARGHGLSDPPTTSDTGDTGVEDLVGFIYAMKIEKPILMGHSMGASTVIRLAAKYTDLPRSVIMLDPGLGARPAAVALPRMLAAPRRPHPLREHWSWEAQQRHWWRRTTVHLMIW